MAWEIVAENGIWLPQIGWRLDASRPTGQSFVSHAHFDHMGRHAEVVCSEPTAALISERLPAKRRTLRALPYAQTEALTFDTTITLYPAGHILGSAQALIEHAEHGRLLYTGDFKLRPSRTVEPCATPSADVLIMETTFGLPRYDFPPNPTVFAEVAAFCRETLREGCTPVLYGYSLGRGQEILSWLREEDLPIVLHPATARMAAVYTQLGQAFTAYQIWEGTNGRGRVVIAPHGRDTSAKLASLGPVRTAVLTGWAIDPATRYRSGCDAAFPVSDHAGFRDLLTFVDQVRPQRVLTTHGFAAEFARTLRERGYDAWALGQSNQMDLGLGLLDGGNGNQTAP